MIRMTSGSTYALAHCESNEFWLIGEKGTPWHFWEYTSRLTGVPKKYLGQLNWVLLVWTFVVNWLYSCCMFCIVIFIIIHSFVVMCYFHCMCHGASQLDLFLHVSSDLCEFVIHVHVFIWSMILIHYDSFWFSFTRFILTLIHFHLFMWISIWFTFSLCMCVYTYILR